MSLDNVEEYPYKEDECRVIVVEYIPIHETKDSFAAYDPDSDIVSVNTVNRFLHTDVGGICVGGMSQNGIYLAFDVNKEDDFEYMEVLFVKYFSEITNKSGVPENVDIFDGNVKLITTPDKFYDKVEFFHNEERDSLLVRLSQEPPVLLIRACRNLLMGINSNRELVELWIQNIVEDPGYELRNKWLRSYPGDFVIFREDNK